MLDFLQKLFICFFVVLPFFLPYFMHPINKEDYWLKLLVVFRGEAPLFLLAKKDLALC